MSRVAEQVRSARGTAPTGQAGAPGHPGGPGSVVDRWSGWRAWVVAALAVALIAAGAVIVRDRLAGNQAPTGMPQNAAIEQAAGVRFTRIAVVGDGGLLEVSYVVLDSEKAARFQSDRQHPPVITSEARGLSTKRVALMKQGHQMRSGQTYYLVYNNSGGVLRAQEQAQIEYQGHLLQHIPVLG